MQLLVFETIAATEEQVPWSSGLQVLIPIKTSANLLKSLQNAKSYNFSI